MENDCDLLIYGALGVIIPKVGVLQLDILIEDGKIKDLRKDSTNVVASNRIDASGRYVIPGVIDPHTHYGVFTPIEKAARTESKISSNWWDYFYNSYAQAKWERSPVPTPRPGKFSPRARSRPRAMCSR